MTPSPTDEDLMDALERLTAIEAIKQLKARYLIAIDAKDWDTYAGVFAPDGLLDLDVEKEYHRGRAIDPGPAGLPGWLAAASRSTTSSPPPTPRASPSTRATCSIIEITGEDTAKGTWGFHDYIVFADGSGFCGYGHYHETYSRIDGEWSSSRWP